MVCLDRPYHFKFFKGYLPQILLGSFQNTLPHIHFKTQKLVLNYDYQIHYLHRVKQISKFYDLKIYQSYKYHDDLCFEKVVFYCNLQNTARVSCSVRAFWCRKCWKGNWESYFWETYQNNKASYTSVLAKDSKPGSW